MRCSHALERAQVGMLPGAGNTFAGGGNNLVQPGHEA
jgi:hypothetical protein